MASTQPGGLFLTPEGDYVDANGAPVAAPEVGSSEPEPLTTDDAPETEALRARIAELEAQVTATASKAEDTNDTARKPGDVPSKDTSPEETAKAVKSSEGKATDPKA